MIMASGQEVAAGAEEIVDPAMSRNIPEAETETVIQPHGMANDLGRKPVILIESSVWQCVHVAITSPRLTLDKPINNLTMPT
jgi:hypothetical protein